MKQYILILLLALPVVSATTTLQSNQTFDFSYSGSGTEQFYCSEPNATTFCALTNLSFSLDPGSTVIRTGSYNRVEAVCTTNVVNQSKCVIDDKLDPGERLRVDTSVCNIDIQARDASDEDSCDIDEVTHEEFVTFKFQGNDLIHVTAGNQSFDVDPRIDSIDEIKHRVTFACPTVIDKYDLLKDDQVINTCKILLPELAQSFVKTTDACLASIVETDNIISDRSNDIRVCEEEKGRFRAQIAELEASNAALTNQSTTCTADLSIANAQAYSERDQKFIFMFLTGLMALVAAFMAWLHFGRGGE